jgi:hypothetical protein
MIRHYYNTSIVHSDTITTHDMNLFLVVYMSRICKSLVEYTQKISFDYNAYIVSLNLLDCTLAEIRYNSNTYAVFTTEYNLNY